jgi:hypothetical protein
MTQEEVKDLIQKLEALLRVAGTSHDNDSPPITIINEQEHYYWLYEDDVIRLVQGTSRNYYGGIELTKKDTFNPVLIIGPGKSYYDEQKVHRIDPELEGILPHLQNLFKNHILFEKDDYVTIHNDSYDTVYRIIGNPIKGYRSHKIVDQLHRVIPVTTYGRTPKSRLNGTRANTISLRKATKEDIQKHFDRWKEIAAKFGVT